MVVVALASGVAALALVPRRSVITLREGLHLIGTASISEGKVTAVSASFSRLPGNHLEMSIRVTASLWSPTDKVFVSLMNGRLGNCSELPDARRQDSCSDSLKESLEELSKSGAPNPLISIKLQPPLTTQHPRPSSGPVPSPGDWIASIVIADSLDSIGYSSGEEGVRATLPSFDFLSGTTGCDLPFTVTYPEDRAPQLIWSGLVPWRFSTSSATWRYSVGCAEQGHQNVTIGDDPTLPAEDNRRLFMAGALAGISGGALLSAIDKALTVNSGRRRRSRTG